MDDRGFYTQAAVPLLAGAISLILTWTNRNSSISDRLRRCSEEVYRNPDEDRSRELVSQMAAFARRFRMNQVALMALLFTAVALVAMSVLAGLPVPILFAQVCFVLAVVGFVLAVALSALDYWESFGTLRAELYSAVRHHDKRFPAAPGAPDTPPAVPARGAATSGRPPSP